MIDDPRAFYLTFDNVEVGRMQAREVLKAMPKGRYVMIKGSPVGLDHAYLAKPGLTLEGLDAIAPGGLTVLGAAAGTGAATFGAGASCNSTFGSTLAFGVRRGLPPTIDSRPSARACWINPSRPA